MFPFSMKLTTTNDMCEVRLDRLVIGADDSGNGMPDIPGFKVVRDTRVRPQGRIATYGRVRRLRSETDCTEIYVQYEKRAPWLRDFRVNAVADDQAGLTPAHINQISSVWFNHRVITVELAFDFDGESGVDRDFILCHGRFGKSHCRFAQDEYGHVRYGTRGSPKLVRCYWKKQIGRYRVELEIHSSMLKKYGITKVTDLPSLSAKLAPAHISLKVMRWKKLKSYLVRKYGQRYGEKLWNKARGYADTSMIRTTQFLAKVVHNPHRFWGSEVRNGHIREALRDWSRAFPLDYQQPLDIK